MSSTHTCALSSITSQVSTTAAATSPRTSCLRCHRKSREALTLHHSIKIHLVLLPTSSLLTPASNTTMILMRKTRERQTMVMKMEKTKKMIMSMIDTKTLPCVVATTRTGITSAVWNRKMLSYPGNSCFVSLGKSQSDC